MEIMSISIDDETLDNLNSIQKSLGFKSRSKMLRNAIASMINDYRSIDSLKGNVNIIFVLTYKEPNKNKVSNILHKFGDAIKTELHQHDYGICIDILNLSAEATRIQEIYSILKKNKSIDSTTYVIVKL
jgi:metal-responsive CopG/Arc/MetJ family transcriptional regulator